MNSLYGLTPGQSAVLLRGEFGNSQDVKADIKEKTVCMTGEIIHHLKRV